MNRNFLTYLLIFSISLLIAKVNLVLVDKDARKMYLVDQNKILKNYDIALGGNPAGHKIKEGDQRTPEGIYYLDYRKENSSFHKALHISYPDRRDIALAKERGVNPGGLIMIHGQKNGLGLLSFFTQSFDWTDGCIAVTNNEMDEIWNLVEDSTKIIIRQNFDKEELQEVLEGNNT